MKPAALVPVDGTNPYFQIDLIISLDDGNTVGSQNVLNSNQNVQYMFLTSSYSITSHNDGVSNRFSLCVKRNTHGKVAWVLN